MKLKKVLALMFTFILVLSSLVGCGGNGDGGKTNKEGGNSETDIEIGYWRSGLGTEWLDAMIEAFEAKYPEYNVYYNESASPTAVVASYGMEDLDTIDLYMCIKDYDTSQMESLNDLLSQTIDGESKTIGEKINPSYLDLEKDAQGNVYQLTYGGGLVGIVYNKKMFEEAGITVEPRTTRELIDACDALFNSGYVPLCHFNPSGYWEYISEVWFAQYNGMDYYMNTFYSPEEPSIDVFKAQDGRYEALKVYESILTSDYVLSGSNSKAHTTVQTEFLNDSAAMMVNGSWMCSEMSGVGNVDNFKTMRTPVISTITDKLTTVKKESELRQLVGAIDSVLDQDKDITEYQSGEGYKVGDLVVSSDDWDYVYSARTTMASNYSGQSMYVPNYSKAKEGAKEFVKFMYSDEGYKIFTEQLHLTLPMSLSEGDINTSEWNAFETEQYKLLGEATQTATEYIMSKHDIFINGGAKPYAGYVYINKFCSNNKADKQNADEVWDSVLKLIDKKYEDDWMANIK